MPSPDRRAWYIDALSGLAFTILTFYVTRSAKALGTIPALFTFIILGGMAFSFCRSAWRGLLLALKPRRQTNR